MKQSIRTLLKAKRVALSKADPKSRDKIRQRVKVLEVARQIKLESKAA